MNTTVQPAVYTVPEVCALLRVSRAHIYQLVRDGEMPGLVKVGRAVRFSRAVIDSMLSQGSTRDGNPRTH